METTEAFVLTAEMRAQAEAAAAQFGVSPALDSHDHLLGFLLDTFKRDQEVTGYFVDGHKDAEAVRAVMKRLGISPNDRSLEFASGYGRVTRHLMGLNVVASDIHPEAVEFTRRELGMEAIQSTLVPEEFEPGERYEFISVVSLFSHLPDTLFGRWLSKLTSLLAPGGYLWFTVHGEVVAQRNGITLDSQGFTYLTQRDQRDLSDDVYGTALVTPEYVLRQIRAAGAVPLSFTAYGWRMVQDEWIVQLAGK